MRVRVFVAANGAYHEIHQGLALAGFYGRIGKRTLGRVEGARCQFCTYPFITEACGIAVL